jgi:hypothetical protein
MQGMGARHRPELTLVATGTAMQTTISYKCRKKHAKVNENTLNNAENSDVARPQKSRRRDVTPDK